MAMLNISTRPAPGVTIVNDDGKITVTIMTKPSSNDIAIDRDTRALWYTAYARLREMHKKELIEFEEQARIVFSLLHRSSSSNASGRSAMAGLHNMAPDTVLGAVLRWITDARSKDEDEKEEENEEKDEEEDEEEEEEEEEVDEVRRALTSTMTLLIRNMQESPSAHLAWVAASLCIQPQNLVEGTKPTYETPGLAYIVSQVAFYDRLSQLMPQVPGDDDGPNWLHGVLVDIYSAILEQLIVVFALGHAPRRTRGQQKLRMFADLNMGVDSPIVHPIIALESSLGFYGRDKTMEKSIDELLRLRAPSLVVSETDDRDACQAANDTWTAKDDDGGGDGDGVEDDDSDDYDSHSESASRDDSKNRISTVNATNDKGFEAFIERAIHTLICGVPVKLPLRLPPSPLPLDKSQSVFEGLRRWALEQDAYKQWRRARSADHGDSTDRILWLHGPEGSSATMLLHALAQAETENQTGEANPEWRPFTVACASWDWTRDLNGTSVVSVLRDLVWTVLTAQPRLGVHLKKAVLGTSRRPLLGGDDNYLQAQYAALGTSCDFYSMLALLCSIIGDPAFVPTCFVIDYRDMLWDDDGDDYDGDEADGDESCKKGRDGSASSAQKRTWTLRDLMALVRTTCRLSDNVAWIVRSMSCLPPSSSMGGFHVYLPEEPVLGEVMHDYIRALLQERADSNCTQDIQKQLASEITGRAGGNVAWSTLAVDLVARARLPWNGINVLQRLPDSREGLGPLLDYIIQSNISENEAGGDLALLDAVLHTAALAFQPLTVPELAALAGLPATVSAVIFFNVLARPLLEIRDIRDANRKAKQYVYFPSRAVLAAQRARLAQATAAPDLHADMVCRHLRQLARHYSKTDCRGQLSVYMKIAWLRHLRYVGIGNGRANDLPVRNSLAAEVRHFVAQNASAWLHDLDALGIFDVTRRMLQDLLPSPRELGRLSPTQAALYTLFTRILRSWEMGMSVTDCDRFMQIAGCETQDDDDSLPVLPQHSPMLPPLDSSTIAFIGTLKGQKSSVSSTRWAYDGRLIVSISDDNTLRCWDRASCTVQQVTEHRILAHSSPELLLSPTDPNLVVAGDMWGISTFDLAIGGVQVESITFDEIVAEWHNQQKEQGKQDKDAAYEMLEPFSSVRFAIDGSNDIIVTCQLHDGCDLEPREVILGMPGLHLKEVRRTAIHYKSLPTKIKNELSQFDCRDASVADNVELAAIIDYDSNLVIYNTKLAEPQQKIRWAQNKFVRVRYDSNIRAFTTWDDRKCMMLHLVYEREERVEQEEQVKQVEPGDRVEQGPSKPSYRSLVRTHRPPYPDPDLSFALSSDRKEILLTFKDTHSCQIYKFMEAEADTRNNVVCVNSTPDIDSQSYELAHAPRPFHSAIFSRDGSRAATCSGKSEVRLWTLPDMTTSMSAALGASDAGPSRALSGRPDSEVKWVCFSSDDTLLLTCHNNGQTVVWDTETCKRVAVIETRRQSARFAAISPRNALVVTVPYIDEPVRFWDLNLCRKLYQKNRRIAYDIYEGDFGGFGDNGEYEDYDDYRDR
ncbi:WD repeat-containing protein 5 [Beauveria bassiana D1-5]|uniref:WD repeat-containing protein 5 n=1 Tax=Beauveria bassiana D1-5 TaxID=1245745 RepID=A0A0A2VRH7_BEABA|nr:WD repeat-containing protein 5 [Beauveria bassiana D1-5]